MACHSQYCYVRASGGFRERKEGRARAQYCEAYRYAVAAGGDGHMKIKPMEEIRALLQSVADGMDIELVDAEFKQGHSPALTVYIDTEDGVDLDTCEKYHRAIDSALDELDPTYGAAYTLNCSSPGLDRPFRTERDFARHLGEMIEVHLYAPFAGAKYHEGKLTAFEGGDVVLETPRGELRIPFEKTSKVCLLIEV